MNRVKYRHILNYISVWSHFSD